MKLIKHFFVLYLLTITFYINGQVTFEDITHISIYEFLDEMANEKLININSAVKPYSKTYIFEKLIEIEKSKNQLNKRQKAELEYFIKQFKIFNPNNNNNVLSTESKINIFKTESNFATSFNPFGLYYKDSLFTLSLQPIWGSSLWINNNDTAYTYWGGAEVNASIGKNLGLYASLRDNHQKPELAKPSFLTVAEGGNYKSGKDAGDYSEMRGGISISWKWGCIAIIKDHIIWGNNYHGSNIFSGRTPSFPMLVIKLNPVKWLDFNYFHGWLISEVIDSQRIYISSQNRKRYIFREKNIAANFFTITPIKNIRVSLGNSIIYCDMPAQPAYLIPIFFYKSVDHTLNHSIDNQNSQMFADISIRAIKHLHIYSSWFVDEFSVSRIFDNKRHNFYSYKIGTKISNWPIKNISVITEFTQTTPITFKHRVPALTFESNKFNLGHYLKDNAREIYSELIIKPLPRFKISLSYNNVLKGYDYPYEITPNYKTDETPILKDTSFTNISFQLISSFELTTNAFVKVGYFYTETTGFSDGTNSAQYFLKQYVPEIYWGKTHTLFISFNIGF